MNSSAAAVSREACVARDAGDLLAAFRDRFVMPDGVIYLVGSRFYCAACNEAWIREGKAWE